MNYVILLFVTSAWGSLSLGDSGWLDRFRLSVGSGARGVVGVALFPDWMSDPNIQNTRLLDLPVIPGTHHSGIINPRIRMSRVAWRWAQCQEMNIESQLLNGVRFLDLRVRVWNNEVYLSHKFLSDTLLRDALEVVKGFLSAHATETVLLLIRHDTAAGFTAERAIKLANVITESEIPIYGTILGGPDKDGALAASHRNHLGLETLLVSQLAGKALIFAEVDSFVPPPGSGIPNVRDSVIQPATGEQIPYIPHISRSMLNYRDIWNAGSVVNAKTMIAEYVDARLGEKNRAIAMKGVALDGAAGLRGQRYNSPIMNQWFMEKFNDEWASTIKDGHPLGIVMLDFITADIIKQLLSANPATTEATKVIALTDKPHNEDETHIHL